MSMVLVPGWRLLTGWIDGMWTKNDREYFEKRMHEEIVRSAAEQDDTLKQLHSRWAFLFQQRLATICRDT